MLYEYTVFSRVSAHGCWMFTGQKTGVGAYMEKLFVRITYIHVNHRIIKSGGWALTQMWVLTQEVTCV